MDLVKLPREDAKNLIEYKKRRLNDRIEQILEKYNQPSAESLLKKAKTGRLENAENDAIVLTNLLEELNKLKKLEEHF